MEERNVSRFIPPRPEGEVIETSVDGVEQAVEGAVIFDAPDGNRQDLLGRQKCELNRIDLGRHRLCDIHLEVGRRRLPVDVPSSARVVNGKIWLSLVGADATLLSITSPSLGGVARQPNYKPRTVPTSRHCQGGSESKPQLFHHLLLPASTIQSSLQRAIIAL